MLSLTPNKYVFDTGLGRVVVVSKVDTYCFTLIEGPESRDHTNWTLGQAVHEGLREPTDAELLAARLKG
jgi:hypothetical protein